MNAPNFSTGTRHARGDAKIDIWALGLASVTRPEIDLHTMETLSIQYGSENISHGKSMRG